MEEQTKAFDEEKYYLDRILGDLRDLLTSIHNYELRTIPESNVPLFFDKEYNNFKKRMESYQLLQLVFQKIDLFEHHLDIEEEVDTDAEVDDDEEALEDTVQVYTI